ncbi:MAG: cytochrome c peroxidase [Hydrogenothermaceae bacterium]
MRKILLFTTLLVFTGSVFSKNDTDKELLDKARQFFSPLPKSFPSEGNPITPQKVELGRLLFFERRLSVNDMISCSTCHAIEYYYSSPAAKQMGALKLQPRHAPTVLNAAGQFVQHWIGNRKDVEDQAFQSLTGPAALGNPSNEKVEEKLKSIPQYVELFRKAFPDDKEPITAENIAKAIGAFERTLVTPSRFDEFLNGNTKILTKEEKKGLKLFIEVGCVACHNGSLLGGNMYQKFGIYEPYWKYTKSESIDEGRYAVTNKEEDRYVFKVPPLRNVAMTPPYFHDGSVKTLEEAVWIMGKVELGKELGKEEIFYITEFLKSLTGGMPKEVRKPPILPN